MSDNRVGDTYKKDSWSDAFNKVANMVIITALVAMIFGLFATFGALMMIEIFY